MNVLIYSGPGTTVDTVQNCTTTCRRLLSPHYAVLNVTSSTLLTEPWAASTSLLVIPGGADLPYCRELDGKGTAEITKYVRNGGKVIAFCAGAYFCSARVEFEVGDLEMEVSGPRELKFFPGIARGAAYKGFNYKMPVNAKAAKVKVYVDEFDSSTPLSDEAKALLNDNPVYSYYHGGCLFVDAEQFKARGVQVLARYVEPVDQKGSDVSDTSLDAQHPAAAVYCPVGKGGAVLTGLHPEAAPDVIKFEPDCPNHTAAVETLAQHNELRVEFMKGLLKKLGLKVNDTEQTVPSITRMCLTSSDTAGLKHLVHTWKEHIGFVGDGGNEIKGTSDTFKVWDAAQSEAYKSSEERTEGYSNESAVKDIDVYYGTLPDPRITPAFDHEQFYQRLEAYRAAAGKTGPSGTLSNTFLYGEVVTSTSTLLFKNFNLLRELPTGFTAVGTVQVAGRGRGNNVWVSPMGVLAFSTVLRMPIQNELNIASPMAFVQYLAAIAATQAIRSVAEEELGIQEFPAFIKWPNDLYLKTPNYPGDPAASGQLLKLSGILVNTTVVDSEFVMVVGIGINVDNKAPSKSLNTLVDELNRHFRRPNNLPPYAHFTLEGVLAKFMAIWETFLDRFLYQGFEPFEQMYYDLWLHSNKVVTLEQCGNVKAIIRGISKDYGMLVAEEVDRHNTPLGKTFELQPDGNSFDMLKGLLKKKD